MLNSLGVGLKQLERFDEALLMYDRALTLNPSYPEAHNNRGNVLNELKRFEEALASRNLEAAYSRMWDGWRRNEAPEPFVV